MAQKKTLRSRLLEIKRQVLALNCYKGNRRRLHVCNFLGCRDAGWKSRVRLGSLSGEGFDNAKCVSEHEFDLLILGNGMLQGTSNFFMSVRTLAGRPIMLSYRALSSFWGMKSFFFGARCKGLKTRINSEYQSKGSIYILHLLAFALISIF